MGDLLLHSMAELAPVILGALEIAGARDLVEVGSEHGTMTALLSHHATRAGGSLTAIDLSPSPEAEAWFQSHRDARLVRQASLEALPPLSADAWIVDGDHNYYTVLHESLAIWERARRSGRRFLVFYHDVGWPWARRDLYYDPARIPAGFRHEHVWDRGVTLEEPGTIEGGFRGEGQWACAAREGGPCNGVLTAIEDFVVGREADLTWALVPAVFGLGVLYERHAPWAPALDAFLSPYHMNPLLATLERNRLACYLRVIEWQDRAHAAA